MRVAIDEAGDDGATGRVNPFGGRKITRPGNLGFRPDRGNAVIRDGDHTAFDAPHQIARVGPAGKYLGRPGHRHGGDRRIGVIGHPGRMSRSNSTRAEP